MRIDTEIVLWGAALAAALIAAIAYYGHAGPVVGFLTALVAVALCAGVLERAIDRVVGRLTSGAVGLFQAATGNLPELLIGAFALRHGLYGVVQGTIADAVVNMLLFGTGTGYTAGGCAALLVVFVILDGEVNHLEGFVLLGLYTVPGSLFWWS